MVNIADRAPLIFPVDGADGEYNTNMASGTFSGFIGVLAWKRGSLLISMIWSSMIVMVIDRKWFSAIAWALVGAFFAAVGLIHVPEAGFKSFDSATSEQCDANRVGTNLDPCWEYAQQWMFMVAYFILAGMFGLIYLTKRFGLSDRIEDEIDDETAHAFDDWFRDAAKGSETFADSDDYGAKDEQLDDTDVKVPAGDSSDEAAEEAGMRVSELSEFSA